MRALLLALAAALAGGCGETAACRVGADCASGICLRDGTCGAPLPDAAPPAEAGGEDAGAETAPDAGTPGDDAPPAVCSPDRDGRVTRAELPIAAGLHATYRVALGALVDTAGSELPEGGRFWDLAGELPGDHSVLVEAQAIEGRWFAPRFPGATYAARLSDAEELLGIFEATDDALRLRGVVSPADGLGRTELIYDPPVDVLRFPVEIDAAWSTTATVSGVAAGVPSWYAETYGARVDAAGEVATPFARFPALRVAVDLRRTVGVLPARRRTFLFVAECFGTVAAVDSEWNERGAEFRRAAEVRRLAP